ncbi:hypothetical protein ABL78_7694 [Leptomonas seymouri]|uniref:Uncharacterized protein n=1 Tax=Leptomonas seymouri TaxID=5684 RepID=A0A0N1PC77_LEPSE|nr:hypothetical protein ABL78_7694 [Leptomonas seymouri]|eukprot:KPI83280.1 hypothetical protein ABL78_7694 [Leptomonas seymouri]
MSDAETYLRRGKKIQLQKFGRAGVAREDGSASEHSDAERTVRCSGVDGVVMVRINDAHRDTRQLPMKKKTIKRCRGDSDSDSAAEECMMDGAPPSSTKEQRKEAVIEVENESGARQSNVAGEAHCEAGELELANVGSPSSAMPPVEGVAQRIGLLAKWFPAALQEGKLEAAVAPGSDFVEATVERMNKARDYVLALRYGIEDVETLLKGTRDTQWRLWVRKDGKAGEEVHTQDARERCYWQVSGGAIAKLVKVSGVGPFKKALSEFADKVPSTSAEVATAVRAVVHRRRRLSVPLEYSPKSWQYVLDTRGPEMGYVPHLSDILWLSVASATAMFAVVTQRLLRGARTLAQSNTTGRGCVLPGEQLAGEVAEVDGQDDVRFFDNTVDDTDASSVSQEAEGRLWLANCAVQFHPELSADEKSVLAFLRYLMPVGEGDGTATQGRTSCGLGVWLYAAFTTLDAPLDPDTSRLAHDLFRACCRHLRTLGAWKGVRGSLRNTLLKEFPSRPRGAKPTYASLNDVAQEDVLALYTIVVVLARFFRQNQDHFIPL